MTRAARLAESVAVLIDELGLEQGAEAELATLLYDRSGGNPFFLMQLIQLFEGGTRGAPDGRSASEQGDLQVHGPGAAAAEAEHETGQRQHQPDHLQGAPDLSHPRMLAEFGQSATFRRLSYLPAEPILR